MPILFEPLPLYFMHVPKTGGTTMGRWLRTAYSRHAHIDLTLEYLHRIPSTSLSSFRCFHAYHLGRELYNYIGRSDLPVITMLRDPIERAASEIRHHQRAAMRNPEKFSPAYMARMQPWFDKDIGDCILDGILDFRVHDIQTRVLGKPRNYDQFFHCSGREEARALIFASYPWQDLPRWNMWVEADDAGNARRAHAWLDQMAVVGLTERYTESLELIADLIGIPVPTNPPRANVNPERSHPTMRYRDRLQPAAMAHLEDLNRHDSELYAHATALFEEQWARYKSKPRRTYSIAAHIRIPLYQARSVIKKLIFRKYSGKTVFSGRKPFNIESANDGEPGCG